MPIDAGQVQRGFHQNALIDRLADLGREISLEHLEAAIEAFEAWAEEDATAEPVLRLVVDPRRTSDANQ